MKKILLFLVVLSISIGARAQKFGYVNSSQLLLAVPDVQKADSQLGEYQKEIFAKGEQMVKKFETGYNAYLAQVNSGELSQLQMQNKEAALTAEQQAIQKYEVDVQEMLARKKQEIYQPILDQVQVMINKVGEELDYTMIFDTSMGGIVFAKEADDLMPILKQRLGAPK